MPADPSVPSDLPANIPSHVAIVMDGNGRWAEQRRRPRTMGHQAGVRALRKVVEHAIRIGIRHLTVFAFSSENWNRPEAEVRRLMDLFMRALEKETGPLDNNGVRLRFIGDRAAFDDDLRDKMASAEADTAANDRLLLNVAVNYGGRWDIVEAARSVAKAVQSGALGPDDVTETLISSLVSAADSGDPDLLIRTGGETRISNFLLWQSAYTELYFTPVLWPDFGKAELDRAVEAYARRERRFGQTGAQIRNVSGA